MSNETALQNFSALNEERRMLSRPRDRSRGKAAAWGQATLRPHP